MRAMPRESERPESGRCLEYLALLGADVSSRANCPFDPGYDPVTVEAHVAQSAHLIRTFKISMATWIVAEEGSTRRKIEALRRADIPVVAGGGPFEVAFAAGALDAYLDLCAAIGVSRIECGEGFTKPELVPAEIVDRARARGLDVEFEVGDKHAGAFTAEGIASLIELGRRWLDAGAVRIVVEARESAENVGLFDTAGNFNTALADRLAGSLGLENLLFEAPNKQSQFKIIEYFGPSVMIGNIRLEELLRVEIFRRGLHSDAFENARLRLSPPA
jgi:phosphosulfolactate synthase